MYKGSRDADIPFGVQSLLTSLPSSSSPRVRSAISRSSSSRTGRVEFPGVILPLKLTTAVTPKA